MDHGTWWQWLWRIIWVPISFFTGIYYLPNVPRKLEVRGIDLEKYYGFDHVPIFKGTFDEAKKECKRQNALLVACFVSQAHEGHKLFLKNTIADETLSAFLREENDKVIFWIADAADALVFNLANQQFKVNRLPAIIMIAMVGEKMTVLRRYEGPCSGEYLMQQIDDMLSALLANRLLEQEEQDRRFPATATTTTGLLQEQDQAYLRSLEIDARKARERREAEAREQERVAAEKIEHERQTNLQEQRHRELEGLREKLAQEYNGTDALRLSLQLPNGKKFVRKFAPVDSMDFLYDWAFSLVGEDVKIKKTSLIVRTLMPPESFPLTKKNLGEAGIVNNMKLIIELI